MPTMRAACPSCGRTLLRNDEAQAISHQEPECPWFMEFIASHPPDETRTVHEGAEEAHMAALAYRVTAKKDKA